VCGRNPRIDRVILSQESQNLNRTRSAAPVPHQVAYDAEEADELHARGRHAVVGDVTDKLGRRAGSLDVGPDVVAFGAQGEGAEGGADVSGDAGQNDLLLASRSDCFAELRIVPGIDFALAGNEWRIGVPGPARVSLCLSTDRWTSILHVKNRLGQRSIRSLLGRGGQHHRQVEQLANAGMRDHGVVVQRGIEVSRQAVQAVLQVQDDEHGVILVEAQEWYGVCDTDASEACEGEDGSELHVDFLEAGGYR